MTFKISTSDVCYIPVKLSRTVISDFHRLTIPDIKGIFFTLLPGINLRFDF